MKNTVAMAGQISFFDFTFPVVVNNTNSTSKDSAYSSIEEFIAHYDGAVFPAYDSAEFDKLCDDMGNLGTLYCDSFKEVGLYSNYLKPNKHPFIKGYVSLKPMQCQGVISDVQSYNEMVLADGFHDDVKLIWEISIDGKPGDKISLNINTTNYLGAFINHKNGSLSVDGYRGNVTALELIEQAQTKFNELSSKKQKKKSSVKLSPIQKFISENNGIVIDDMSNEASVNAKKSESFMKFCKELRNALRKEAKAVGFDGVTLCPGHYDLHGYFNKGDKYVYWSFSIKRYDEPTYLDKSDYMNGFLYRTAKSEKDSTGGHNNYTDLANLVTSAYSLI